MRIFIDADACPRPIKEVIYNIAKNRSCEVIFVTNQFLSLPILANLKLLQVNHGFDAADNEIVKLIESGDLLISNDIPLASQVIAKDATVITTSGKVYNKNNIQTALAMRDLTTHLRDNLQIISHHKPFSVQDKINFTNMINKYVP